MHIILDAGHGAYCNPYPDGSSTEGRRVYEYSLMLEKELLTYKGVKISKIRKNVNENPNYINRGLIYTGDLYLSLHTDAHSSRTVSGVTVFDSHQAPNNPLGQALLKAISSTMGIGTRGVIYRTYEDRWMQAPSKHYRDYFAVLRNNNSKSRFLIEHGFHTNANDRAKINNDSVMQAVATVTANTIAQHYKLQKITSSKPITQTNKKLYKVQIGAFREREKAQALANKAKAKGFDVYVTQ